MVWATRKSAIPTSIWILMTFCYRSNAVAVGTDNFHQSSDYEVVTPEKITHKLLRGDVELRVTTKTRHFHISLKENSEIYSNLQILIDEVYVKSDCQSCHYHGVVLNARGGNVIMNDCDGGFSGTIFMKNNNKSDIYYIKYQPENKQHVFFQHKDDVDNTNLPFKDEMIREQILRTLVPTFRKRIRRSIGIFNNVTKYISLAIVVDNATFVNEMNSNITLTKNYIYALVNHIDYIYKATNVRVALTHLQIWTVENKFNVTSKLFQNLQNFEKYNKNNLVTRYGWNHDNAQMIIGIEPDGGLTGLAAEGSLCNDFSAGVSYLSSKNAAIVAGTMAHEMGHNFGAPHNSDSCICTQTPCMMGATFSYSPVNGLTDCTMKAFNDRCMDGWCLCLLDKPTQIEGGPMCGNGFVEEGEECDCGKPEYCDNKCCDPYKCKRKFPAICASGTCCENCLPKPKGTICRAKAGECDIQEYCDGYNGECPDNTYVHDFASCENNQSFCHFGLCTTSLGDQCQTLWGPNGRHGDCKIGDSYINMRGNEWGNCGKTINGFKACALSDVACGKLQCYGEDLAEYILFGEARSTLSYNVDNGRCVSGQTNTGKDTTDMTLAKPGSKCAENKVCYNQKCSDVSIMKLSNKSLNCYGKCGPNGICTNTDVCYCKPGYQCPYCQSRSSKNNLGELCNKKQFINRIKVKKCRPACSQNGICDGSKGVCYCSAGYKCPDCIKIDIHNIQGGYCETKKNIKENEQTSQSEQQKMTCIEPSENVLKIGFCTENVDSSFVLLSSYRDNIDWENFKESMNMIVCKCAAEAKKNGYEIMAIRFWGECWASNSIPKTFTTSDKCQNSSYETCVPYEQVCVGDESSSYLFQII